MVKKRLVVETSDEIGFCHNPKCNFINVGFGCCDYEEGDKPNCPLCYKPQYPKTDGTDRIGSISEVDI